VNLDLSKHHYATVLLCPFTALKLLVGRMGVNHGRGATPPVIWIGYANTNFPADFQKYAQNSAKHAIPSENSFLGDRAMHRPHAPLPVNPTAVPSRIPARFRPMVGQQEVHAAYKSCSKSFLEDYFCGTFENHAT